MHNDLKKLYQRLNYAFKQPTYLKQALTHRSVGSQNYERFEFLGDSILSFVISQELFGRFPSHSEGDLSRLRAFLVKGDMLADIAKELCLGDFLILGQGELKSGGFRRASILADAIEAIFAAIYLDGGIEAAKQVILKLYQSRLEDSQLINCLKDAKTQLQEYLQAKKQPLPEYILNQIKGEEHDQQFFVTCTVVCLNITAQGQGPTRRKAEQLAAQALLSQLNLSIKPSS